jgi:uncharacterized repeat protein (TIGR03803 family)
MKAHCTKALSAITFLLAGMSIFTVPAQASGFIQVDYGFGGSPAGYATSGLVADSSGNLYGEVSTNNNCSCGLVYKLSPQPGGTWQFAPIHEFTGPDGLEPQGGLIFDSSGNLYGTTYGGGATGNGTVFVLHPTETGWAEKVLYSFGTTTNDVLNPYASLTMDSSGNLYGTAENGGTSLLHEGCDESGCGGVFKLTRTGEEFTESVLYNFTGGDDGAFPNSNVIFDSAGNLYGTTTFSNAAATGTIFELSPSTGAQWTDKTLYAFTGGTDGGEPFAGLIFDAAGNLYGTTSRDGDVGLCNGPGCGTVFQLSPQTGGTWSFNVILTFNGSNGANPVSNLIIDSADNLYGTTPGGGEDGYGTVFRLSPSHNNWVEEFVSFSGNNGVSPYGTLLLNNGFLYGATQHGGHGYGVVFDIKL